MRRTKRILQWLVGIAVGLYLAAALLVNIPFVQRWMASGAKAVLEEVLETRVGIGRVEIAWNGRVIVTDLVVDDRQGEEMLRVARVAARLGIRDLINRRIRIGNAQLFGLHANLYQECEGCPANFQFVIDAFRSQDTTSHTPLDLRISQVLVRRGNIHWQQRWRTDTLPTRADLLDITGLDMTAQVNCLTDDSLALRLKRLDFVERSRGLELKSLAFNLEAGTHGGRLTDFRLALPESWLEVTDGEWTIQGRPDGNGQTTTRYRGALSGHVAPRELAFLSPRLAEADNVADLSVRFQGENDRLNVTSLNVRDGNGDLRLSSSAYIANFTKGTEHLEAKADIASLFLNTSLLRPYVSNPMLDRLKSVQAQGSAAYHEGLASAALNIETPLGTLDIDGRGRRDGTVDATLKSQGLKLGELLDRRDLGMAAFEAKATGTAGKQPDLELEADIAELDYRGYRYHGITLDGHLGKQRYEGRLAIADPYATLAAEGKVDLSGHRYNVRASVDRLSPHMLNLTQRYRGATFSGELLADVSGREWKDWDGVVQLNQFTMTDSTGTFQPGDIHLTARPSDGENHLLLISPFLEAQVQGNIEPQELAGQVRQMVSLYLPQNNQSASTTPATKTGTQATPSPTTEQQGSHASFVVRAYNAQPLSQLLGIPLTLDGMLTAHGEIDSRNKELWMKLKAPGLQYGKEQLRDIDLRLESNFESMLASAEMQRLMKGRWVSVGMDARGHDKLLTTRLYFSNKGEKVRSEKVRGETEEEETEERLYAGDITIISRLWRDMEGRQGYEGRIQPSNFIISDTLWTVHPGHLTYYDNVLQIDSFQVSQANRFIKVDGRASQAEGDTLHAQLQRINLEYIFSLINFHAVELGGEATGHAYAHSLFASPKADAYIRIPQFALNYATMGDLDIHVNWGRRPYSIFLDGKISGNSPERTLVKGYVTPKKDVDYHGLDLNIQATRVNLAFINKWTSAIFDDLRGQATGWVRVFGPFKQINIEGDALVNEASVGIPFIGVRYRVENDSVQLRPDNIYFHNAHIYDPLGAPGTQGHSATVSGHLHHDSFKNLRYNIGIEGQNILGYNFTDFGDMNFYGTVYATGSVALQGYPGNVRIDIKARPERGTTFTYNATSPDRLTETPFVTYVERVKSEERRVKNLSNNIEAEGQPDGNSDSSLFTLHSSLSNSPLPEAPASDLHINFDLDIDQQSTMNLLMDARSGDKITVNGSGHMLAHYYNKGSFDLFGTYRVSRGTYNLSLQEVIHKNFEFSNDGSISFNGEPYDADLNLQAIHTVSGVSLNDINPKANFSNTTTRVNCLMNIGGKARAPRITFDFDIPQANEEEKQMVRSLISTEEERNMQVIYLLGIGRFYAYDYANATQTQGTTAMNSLLSSTLSGTINQALSNMIGLSNWNFGANLRTGQDGWNDMDVEGMLQGSLLNNRLLINGNFGYRDNPVATSNFIGDFDVKYLLTRSGSVALKAYSETNDRYFTKSSLTTQGIGILLKKDFTSWRDLVGRKKKNKKSQ